MKLEEILSVPALLTAGQKLSLALTASQLAGGSTIVEIGPFHGGSTKILLENSSDCTLYTIDLYDNIDRNLVDVGTSCELVIGGAREFVRRYEGDAIDFLFVDGDHSFFGVKDDFTTLAPFLKKGSIVAFHDYGERYVGVTLYVNALQASGAIESYAQADSLLFARFTGDYRPLGKEDYRAGINNLGSANTLAGVSFDEQEYQRYSAIISAMNEFEIVGTGAFGQYFTSFFDLDSVNLVDSKDAVMGGKYIVCSHYFDEIQEYLIYEKGARSDDVLKGEDVLSYGFFADLLDNHGQRIRSVSRDADEQIVAREMAKLPKEDLWILHSKGMLNCCFKRVVV